MRELAAGVGEHRARLSLDLHAHVGQADPGDAVDDLACDGGAALARRRVTAITSTSATARAVRVSVAVIQSR